jgi:hypothetical protein
MFCDIGMEAAAGFCAGVIGVGSQDGLEAWQGELGVDGDGKFWHEDEGIDYPAIFECVLETEAVGGEDIGQKIAQGPFAKLTAELGIGEDILEAAEVRAKLDYLA